MRLIAHRRIAGAVGRLDRADRRRQGRSMIARLVERQGQGRGEDSYRSAAFHRVTLAGCTAREQSGNSDYSDFHNNSCRVLISYRQDTPKLEPFFCLHDIAQANPNHTATLVPRAAQGRGLT